MAIHKNAFSKYSLLALAFFGLICFIAAKTLLTAHPSDSNLLLTFQEKKSEYEQLLVQFQTDDLVDQVTLNSSRDYSLGENEEFKKYQQALKDLGVVEVFNSGNGKSNIWFVISSTSLRGRKGLAYINNPEYKTHIAFYTVNSTDDTKRLPRDGDQSSDTFYVPIEDNWYIFYEEFGD